MVMIDVDEIDDVTEALEPPPRSGWFLRPEVTLTIEDILDDLPPRPAVWGGGTHNLSVRLEDDEPTIVFGGHEVPATSGGVAALASYFGVPTKFLARVDPDEQQFILDHRIDRSKPENIAIQWSSEGLIDIKKASMERIEVIELLEVAQTVMPEGSLALEWVNTPEMFFLDLVVPQDFDAYVGGDRKVGDISAGGLRWFQDRARNLAPSVQPIIFRYACTNGMQVSDTNLKIDARGMEPHQIVADLRNKSRQALDGIMKSITAFYDLRSQKIGEDPTGVLHRLVRENDLPTRSVVALEDALPAYLQADFGLETMDEVNMFHLTNLLTNAANNGNLAFSGRRRLESLGGDMVNDHIARCSACHSRLN
jgi:hypothetical protein